MLTDLFMYTNTELSALKYHHTQEKKKKKIKQSIITFFELAGGRRASGGFFTSPGILSESVVWFLRALCDVWGLVRNI